MSNSIDFYKRVLLQVIAVRIIVPWSNGKVTIILSKVGLIKKMLYRQYMKMDRYYPKPYKPFGGDIGVKLDLLNYATKMI